jgi:hypothetical protein
MSPESQRRVDTFNLNTPVGSPVLYRRDDGSALETITRSRAEVLSGHTPVVWIDKVAGCVDLRRVERCK